MRIPHYIKQNAAARMPHHILVVDTEANIERNPEGQNQTFRLGCAIYLCWNHQTKKWIETEYMLTTLNSWFELLDSLTKPKRRLLIFAHNAAYDYTILMMDTYLSTRDFITDTHVIDTAFIVNAHKTLDDSLCSLTFASTTNYYKKPLDELGEIFGDNKLTKPDFENVSNYELMKYCMQDTRVLATLIKKHIEFIKLHDLGNFKLTIAGQAFGAFRHRFMSEKILVHTYDDILRLELESYRGGRCEVFKMGKHDDIYKLDINSMYPFIMRNQKFPTQLISGKKILNGIGTLESLINDDIFVLADCDIHLEKPGIAIKKDKLLFPVGNVRQVLTSPEIQMLIENPNIGSIIKVHESATYKQANLFKQYVDYFYDVRMNAKNAAYEAMAKLFLNSLYGKFGQRSFAKYVPVTDPHLIETLNEALNETGTNVIDWLNHDVKRYIRLGDRLYSIDNSLDILAYDSCPVIASTVTSYARDYLFEVFLKAGLENVLYCDTDSVFVTESGYSNLKPMIHQTELGKLKVEEFGSCEIFGAKNYQFNGSIKLKGVKKDAEKIAPNTYKQSQFLTKNLRYRQGIPDGIVKVVDTVRHISLDYDKGMVDDAGTVHPLVFSDF